MRSHLILDAVQTSDTTRSPACGRPLAAVPGTTGLSRLLDPARLRASLLRTRTRPEGDPVGTDTSRVVQRYDRAMYADDVRSIWGDSDFCNFGYWRPETTDHKQACQYLVDTFLAFIPEKRGHILAHRWVSRFRSSATVRNVTVDPGKYREAYVASGFRDVQIIDATTESINRLCRYHRRWCASRLSRSWDLRPLFRLMLFDLALLAGTRQYLLLG